MKHAKNYSIYARECGHRKHTAAKYEIEIIDGKPCCGLCTYPLAGVWRIVVNESYKTKLLQEIALWGINPNKYQLHGNTIVTGDINTVDVASETFINAPSLVQIERLS